jgi:nicotinamide-nucleotide amidase
MMYQKNEVSGIKDYMLKKGETLSVAESVTAGHLQAALSLAEGATNFFQGGITAYNMGQKSRHLRVDPIHALSCNCVSERIAAEMAIHARELFSSHWAIAITGYAAPVPELDIHNLFAFYSIAFGNKIMIAEKINAEGDDVLKVQLFYTNLVITRFHNYLKHHQAQA